MGQSLRVWIVAGWSTMLEAAPGERRPSGIGVFSARGLAELSGEDQAPTQWLSPSTGQEAIYPAGPGPISPSLDQVMRRHEQAARRRTDEALQRVVCSFHTALENILAQNWHEVRTHQQREEDESEDHSANDSLVELRHHVHRYATRADASEAALFAKSSSGFFGIAAGSHMNSRVDNTSAASSSSQDRHSQLNQAAHTAGSKSRELIKTMRHEDVTSLTTEGVQALMGAWEKFCEMTVEVLRSDASEHRDLRSWVSGIEAQVTARLAAKWKAQLDWRALELEHQRISSEIAVGEIARDVALGTREAQRLIRQDALDAELAASKMARDVALDASKAQQNMHERQVAGLIEITRIRAQRDVERERLRQLNRVKRAQIARLADIERAREETNAQTLAVQRHAREQLRKSPRRWEWEDHEGP